MNKKEEFLRELSEKLAEGMSRREIYSQIQYYAGYIDGEVARGKSVEDAVEELGEPILIARTILESPREEDSFFGSPVQDARDAYEEGTYQGENQYSTEEIRAAVHADKPLGEEEESAFGEETKGGTDHNAFESQGKGADAYEEASEDVESDTVYENQDSYVKPKKEGLLRDDKGNFRWDLFGAIVAAIVILTGITYLTVQLVSALWPVIIVLLVVMLIAGRFRGR